MKLYFILAPPNPSHNELYWRAESKGYTTDIFEAGLYTEKEALSVENLKRGDKKVHLMDNVIKIYDTYKSCRRLIDSIERYQKRKLLGKEK